MGVIKKFAYGRTPPILRSSEESFSSLGLSIPSTPPSEVDEPPPNQRNNFHPHRRDPGLLIQRLEHLKRKTTGARKTRREENARALQTLVESNEEGASYSPTIEDLRPASNSPLTKLMTDFTCMSIWQYFIASSEEEQITYLNSAVNKRATSEANNLRILFTQAYTGSTEKGRNPQIHSLSPEQRFSLVDSNLRNVLKRRNMPLAILSSLEKDVMEVFRKDKAAVYLSQELSSFERLLLHGISQYHLLKSWSVNVAGCRRTKIENRQCDFSSPKMTLTEFLERRVRLLNRS